MAPVIPVDAIDIVAYGPVTPTSGWILTGDRLFLTQNAGATWQDAGPAAEGRRFLAADFVADGAGWLVAADAANPDAAVFALAQTEDFGATWRWSSFALPSQEDAGAVIGEMHLELASAHEGTLRVRYMSSSNFERTAEWHSVDAGASWTRVSRSAAAAGGSDAVRRDEVFLADGADGWRLVRAGECAGDGGTRTCEQETRLQATHDGGASWADLTLPAGLGSPRRFVVSDRAAGVAGTSGSRTMIAIGHGFDKCEVATLDQLRVWWDTSPYSTVNLYIGGNLRACSNRALTADYVYQIYDMGWSVIPTWVGPQAPCTGYSWVISYDPATAQNQGWQEAQAAAGTLARLGLVASDGTGSIAYYDMEAYDTNNGACNAAVRSFVLGWTQGMHAAGHLAGVYGLGPTLGLFANLPQPPDAIWAAHWISSSYNQNASVWNVYRLGNDVWVNHQRLRQYAGGHNEKWGSLTLNIDSNVLDGPVGLAGSAPRPVKPTFTLTPTVTPTATSTPAVTATPTPTRTPYPFTPTDWFYLPLLMQGAGF